MRLVSHFPERSFQELLSLQWTRLWQDWQFWTNRDRSGLGNSSCCCHVCSCTVPPRGGLVKKSKLRERFAQFASGQWDSPIGGKCQRSEEGSDLARRSRRREKDEVVKRAARAEKLVHLGGTASFGGRSCRSWHPSHAGSSDGSKSAPPCPTRNHCLRI